MTIFQIISYLQDIAKVQPNVNSTGEGDIYEFYNGNPTIRYSTFFLTQGQHSETEDMDRYNLTLFYVDRLTDDGSNKLQIQSTGKETLSNIIRTFTDTFDAETETVQYQPFTQRFNDMCAGVYATLTFELMKDSICTDGEMPFIHIKNQTKTVEIKNNGHYEVLPDADYSGMDKVVVDVDVKGGSAPVLESLLATENKTYTPNEGVDGFDSVKVDVPMPVLPKLEENKAVEVRTNGKSIVVPSEGFDALKRAEIEVNVPIPTFETEELTATENKVYTPTADGYSKVTVNVPIPEFKTEAKIVDIVKNGQMIVRKSDMVDGMTEVTVNTAVPIPTFTTETKTVSITSNGQTVIDKSSSVDGMTQVIVNTNVEAKAPILGVLKAAQNKIYEVPSDIDGWNRVEVAVPMPIIPRLEESKAVQILSNGQTTVVPSEGFEGLKKAVITVDVPKYEPKLQEKTVVENGSVVADNGFDGLSKVNVNVPIPTFDTEELRVIENGTYTPSTDGFSKVVVDVPIPVEKKIEGRKTVDVVENGTVQIDPSVGFDGIAGATVNVAVPIPEFTTEELVATDNGVFTPSTDGYSKVTVSVPQLNVEPKKTVSIVANGKTTVNAEAPYDGFKSIDIDVNVPSSGGSLDWSETGYDNDVEEKAKVNSMITDDIAYTKEKYAEWNASNKRIKFDHDKRLVYAPLIDTSMVSSLHSFFDGCINLRYVPLLDTSKVYNMEYTFMNCSSLFSVPLIDTSGVTNMQMCFQGCSSLVTVPLLDTSSVENMASLFQDCYSLTTVPALNTSNVTNMVRMFNSCGNLVSIPLLNASKVEGMLYAFSRCGSLVDLGGFQNLKVSIDLSNSPKLTKQSLMNVIGNLATVTTRPTFKMGAENLAKLTEEEIAVGVAKGWQIVA